MVSAFGTIQPERKILSQRKYEVFKHFIRTERVPLGYWIVPVGGDHGGLYLRMFLKHVFNVAVDKPAKLSPGDFSFPLPA
ncbi:uncharacterized protein ARMOST_19118 [Armillaria ostoyae]|uniref:Uncharacterized protein n=1 Tax=Armillaria ostoyae TaxID=47428 RepID=A0A284S3M5_ARMOS|nr:uncharacterized protein ARMOST_19118 [Armillaria ostoyae]